MWKRCIVPEQSSRQDSIYFYSCGVKQDNYVMNHLKRVFMLGFRRARVPLRLVVRKQRQQRWTRNFALARTIKLTPLPRTTQISDCNFVASRWSYIPFVAMKTHKNPAILTMTSSLPPEFTEHTHPTKNRGCTTDQRLQSSKRRQTKTTQTKHVTKRACAKRNTKHACVVFLFPFSFSHKYFAPTRAFQGSMRAVLFWWYFYENRWSRNDLM